MIILYIPFPRAQAGDLGPLITRWQINHKRNSLEEMVAIFQNDDYDHESIISHSSVYICAHGYEDELLEVGNDLLVNKAQRVNMVTLAERFTNDLIPISFRLSFVHLYCCGSHKKNKSLALNLKDNLLRSEFDIRFYSGNVTIADEKGCQWSFGNEGKKPVENTCSFLHNVLREDISNLSWERSIKQKSHMFWHKEARMKRMDGYFKLGKKARQAQVEFFREKKTELPNPVKTNSPANKY